MKISFHWPIIIVMGLLSGCSSGDSGEKEPVNFTVQLPAQFTIEESSTSTDVDINEVILLDATTNTEIQQNQSTIDNYTISDITFSVVDYNSSLPDEIYFNGTIGFGSISSTQPGSTCPASNVNITHFAGTGSFKINLCSSLSSNIEQLLEADNGLKIWLTGQLTKTPVSFKLNVLIATSVDA